MDAIFMDVSGGYFLGRKANQASRIYPMDRGGNMMGWRETRGVAARSTVIARFNRAIQYSRGGDD
ncbi:MULTISPECIES: hypothetical protein [unclassified Bradyrhizobium]|uniref:hypothetical protein n=1 Tax=unclassified Bradyrhizobium TaxID=2631580 RepID=UPI0030C69506